MSKLVFPKATIQKALLNRRAWTKRRLILWLIGIIALGISVLVFARVEPVVYLRGQLKEQEVVKRFELPQDSIIHEIYIKQGEAVKAGQKLLSFDVVNSFSKVQNLKNIQKSLKEENDFYKKLVTNYIKVIEIEEGLMKLNLSQEKISLINSTINLMQNNQQLKQISIKQKKELSEKIKFFQTLELDFKPSLASEEILKKQTNNFNYKIKILQNQLTEEQKKLNKIEDLLAEKAVSYLQYREQEERVKNKQNEINQVKLELQRLELVFQPIQKDSHQQVSQQEKPNIIEEISNLQEQIVLNQKTIIEQEERINKNRKKINQYLLENTNKINDLENEIKHYNKKIKYNYLYSPFNGKINKINIKNPDNLQIISEKALIAEVFVPYADYQLIQENLPVEVKIKGKNQNLKVMGKIMFMGTDILPPNQKYPFYRLPVYVSLQNKELVLKSDMAVTIKCPIAQKRTILDVVYKKIGIKIHQVQSKGGL